MRFSRILALWWGLFFLFCGAATPVYADSAPFLVKDLNQFADPNSHSWPEPVVVWNNVMYFVTDDGVHGAELWKSDGTVAGTALIKDINPTGHANPTAFQLFQNMLYFAADDGVNGEELWRSDGTANGTVLVKDIRPNGESGQPDNLLVFNNVLYFTATSDGFGAGRVGYELWQSDGTAAGTTLFKDIHPNGSSNPVALTIFNNFFYFIADDGATRQLWRSNGTSVGTAAITTFADGIGGEELFLLNNTFYFTAADSTKGLELWRSNGAPGGATLVKDIQTGSGSSIPTAFALLNNILYFTADDGVHGEEVWRSDGTNVGTILVKDIDPNGDGVDSAAFDYTFGFVAFNGSLYFSANDGSLGTELWKTDGTAAGTQMVRDIYVDPDFPVFGDANPDYLTVFNGALYFAAEDSTAGIELWQSNGTTAGTTLFKEINAQRDGSSTPGGFILFNNLLYFQADDGLVGAELWRTDGTAAGTTLFLDLNAVSNGSTGFSGHFAAYRGMVYFDADDGRQGHELWRSDGTPAGTTLLKEINPGSDDSYPSNFIVYHDSLYFAADDGVTGAELWQSDGTAAGTTLLQELNPAGDAGPRQLIIFKDLLYFLADDGVHGVELWRSDGTATGAQLVKDIRPGVESSWPVHLTSFQGELYFMADDGVNGYALWRSDGSAAGTALVKDIDPATDNAAPIDFVVFRDHLYFQANSDQGGYELWQSDGSAAGTQLLKDIHPGPSQSNPGGLTVFQDHLYFSAEDGIHGNELWRTAGTAAGTGLVSDIDPADSSYPARLVVYRNHLYFTAYTLTNGRELWQSDGTAAGTILFKALRPGSDENYLDNFTLFHDRLYFSGEDGNHDWDLWQSDGTPAGTAALTTQSPINGFVNMTQFMVADTALFFVGDDGIHGAELWALTNPDVMLTQRALPSTPVAPGDAVTYTLTFRNIGTRLATNVIITAQVPAAFALTEMQSALDGGGVITQVATAPLRWQVNDLPPQTGGILTLHGHLVAPLAPGVLSATGQISGVDDFAPSNNNANVALTVRNVAPIAAADLYTATEDIVFQVAGPALLQNDLDLNDDTLTAAHLTPPTHGQLTLASSGGFIYTPTVNFNGDDHFVYLVSDGALTATAQVKLTVRPVNDPPIANASVARTVGVGAIVTLQGNGNDPDGTTTFHYEWTQTSGPLVVLDLTNPAQPTFIAPASPAVLTFTLVVHDEGDLTSAPVNITITVSDTPPPAALNYLPIIRR